MYLDIAVRNHCHHMLSIVNNIISSFFFSHYFLETHTQEYVNSIFLQSLQTNTVKLFGAT